MTFIDSSVGTQSLVSHFDKDEISIVSDQMFLMDADKSRSIILKKYFKFNGNFKYEDGTIIKYPKTLLMAVIPGSDLWSVTAPYNIDYSFTLKFKDV